MHNEWALPERRKDMTTIAIANMIKDHYTLSQKAQIVIDFLGRVSNNITRDSFYSQKTMAEKLHISYSSIQRAIRELKAIGVLIVKPRHDMDHNGRQTSNLYTIVTQEELQKLIREEKMRREEEFLAAKETEPKADLSVQEIKDSNINEQVKMDRTRCCEAEEVTQEKDNSESDDISKQVSYGMPDMKRYQRIREAGVEVINLKEPRGFAMKKPSTYLTEIAQKRRPIILTLLSNINCFRYRKILISILTREG